jgi:neogenin
VRPTSDKLYVLWTQPANPNIRVRSYILGWGKGIPDMYSQELDEKTRNYIIEKLEANSEYVLSLRANNERGTGPPVYTTVRTQDEPPPEPTPPLIPPVGLKAQILSATSVVLYWTDTTLSKSQVRILNQVKDRKIFLSFSVREGQSLLRSQIHRRKINEDALSEHHRSQRND